MNENNRTKITFGSRSITLSGNEDSEYVTRLADYLNGKTEEMASTASYKRLTENDRTAMLLFNIADDYFKAKDRADRLEKELQRLEAESEEMRYRFVRERMKQEKGK
ncbi:MAG: cell division protein ZapA [Lachnospiraceae bacterium]|nr:cell division protein ZapA [Lachnospiraceae bacterium]